MKAVPTPKSADAFAYRGSLRTAPLAHVLIALLDHKKTGTLRLLDTEGLVHAQIRLDAGLPVAVRSSNQGSTLVQSLIPLCACADGDYVFAPEVDDVGCGAGAVVGRADPVALINAAMRGPLRDDAVDETVAALSERLLRLHPRVNLARYKFTEAERQIVTSLEESPATVEELCARPGANARLVRRVVYVLQTTRGLSPVPGPRAVSGTMERVVPPVSLPPSAAGESLPPSAASESIVSPARPTRAQATLLEAPARNPEAEAAGRYHVRYADGGPTDVVSPAREGSVRAVLPASQSSQERQAEAEERYREAQVLLRRSDYPAALNAAHLALRAYGSASYEALYAWLLYLSGGDPDKVPPRALRHLERALQREPDCADAHYYLGMLLMRMGRDHEALLHWRRVLRVKPGHQDTARAVRLHEMRRQSQSSGGFLAKLFGRAER